MSRQLGFPVTWKNETWFSGQKLNLQREEIKQDLNYGFPCSILFHWFWRKQTYQSLRRTSMVSYNKVSLYDHKTLLFLIMHARAMCHFQYYCYILRILERSLLHCTKNARVLWFAFLVVDWYRSILQYSYVTVGAMASQITSISTVCPNICSGSHQRKYQSSGSLAFVRGIHRRQVDYPKKGPVTRKMLSYCDVIMVNFLSALPITTGKWAMKV